MLEQNLKSVLSAQPAITALIGSRSYPVLLPEDSKLPALTFQIVGSSSGQTLTTGGMSRVRVQLDCWGSTYADAVTLREAVSSSLDGYQDVNITALVLSKIDYYERDALQYRATVELYLFTNQF